MFSEKLKLSGSLDTYERLAIEGDEANELVGCYPDMTTYELHQTLITNMETGVMSKVSKWVVDYKGSLTPELVQALADKWDCKITWRGKTYE
jgi:hypothetical protein